LVLDGTCATRPDVIVVFGSDELRHDEDVSRRPSTKVNFGQSLSDSMNSGKS
jgi:hypothetical protein